jgi:DNA-binding response OmpR family regulator
MADTSSTQPSQAVLLVEDEPILAINTQMMLSAIGFDKVEVAASVKEAFALIDANSFSLAILDLSLGGETSLPIAEHLCSENVPVIITTGFEQVSLPRICEGTPILRKPFRLADLESAIAPMR